MPAAGAVAGGTVGGSTRRVESESAAEPIAEHPAEPLAELELAAGEPA